MITYVAIDGSAVGYIVLSDTVRPESAQMIGALEKNGFKPCC